jgi:hypothetical protein
MLIRDAASDRVVAEAGLPSEATLHDALTTHPELLPAEDMGLGRLVVVGRESGLTSGSPDLILLDERGQICVVEVKKQDNSDVRRVVAQLLDYAAALWGKTPAEFERDVFISHARKHVRRDAPTLREFLLAEFVEATESSVETGAPPAVEEIEARLAENLSLGRFHLVVAAPDIRAEVRRVLEYLNAQGQLLYGLEVSYFNLPDETSTGDTECFVPRLVVQPPPVRTPPPPPPLPEWDEERILQRLRQHDDGEAEAEIALAIFRGADRLHLKRWYGSRQTQATCVFGREDEKGRLRPFSLSVFAKSSLIYIRFKEMAAGRQHPALQPEDKRKELQRRLNKIPGILISDDQLDGWPNVPLTALSEPDAQKRFLSVMEWALDQMDA